MKTKAFRSIGDKKKFVSFPFLPSIAYLGLFRSWTRKWNTSWTNKQLSRNAEKKKKQSNFLQCIKIRYCWAHIPSDRTDRVGEKRNVEGVQLDMAAIGIVSKNCEIHFIYASNNLDCNSSNKLKIKSSPSHVPFSLCLHPVAISYYYLCVSRGKTTRTKYICSFQLIIFRP